MGFMETDEGSTLTLAADTTATTQSSRTENKHTPNDVMLVENYSICLVFTVVMTARERQGP